MANIFNLYGPGIEEPGDIPPPGVKITNYRVSFASNPWREIECDLVNGSKLVITFLGDQQYTEFKEEHNNFPQSFAYEKPYGYKYSVYFQVDFYEQILDLLRNEKPMYFVVITGNLSLKPKVAFILTEEEPVGAEESLESAFSGVILYRKGNIAVNISDLIKEQLKKARIPAEITKQIISHVADVSKMGLKSLDVYEIVEQITKDPKLRSEFIENPRRTVRKIIPGR